MIATDITQAYLAYVTFTFVLAVTPGQVTAVVVRNTLEGGRRAGYLTALGAAVGNTTTAIVSGLGLSALIAFWPGSVDVITIAGALFLAWLGVSSLWRALRYADGGIRLSLDAAAPPQRSHAGAYFGDGLAINLLNPAILTFYVSVVPSFIPAGAPRFYYPVLASSHVGIALLCHSTWATGLDAMRRWFVAPWTRRLLQAVSAVILLILSARMIL